MNHIIKLSKLNNNNIILIVVNKLIKYTHFIPTIKKININ
jgi:hypothetical protein